MRRRTHGKPPSRRARAALYARSAQSTCPSGKLAYFNAQDAATGLRNLKAKQGADSYGMAPYKCGRCPHWHLGHGLGDPP